MPHNLIIGSLIQPQRSHLTTLLMEIKKNTTTIYAVPHISPICYNDQNYYKHNTHTHAMYVYVTRACTITYTQQYCTCACMPVRTCIHVITGNAFN